MGQADRRVDAVFEGGGVKGIALIGAAAVIEASGYQFYNLAGTSAGAIVAALLGAGYTAAEFVVVDHGDRRRVYVDALGARVP